mgnify:CR=1 FL=1
MKVLITGGAGFIGSTIASCCADNGITPVILDDYSTGLRAFAERFDHYEGDIADVALLHRILDEHPDIEAVVHCAAKIVVPESVSRPLYYYENNVGKATTCVRTLSELGVKRVLLSSTAAMYIPGEDLMVTEQSTADPSSPYAASKWSWSECLPTPPRPASSAPSHCATSTPSGRTRSCAPACRTRPRPTRWAR